MATTLFTWADLNWSEEYVLWPDWREALRLRLADRNCVLQVPPRLSPGGGKPAGQDEDGRKC